VMVSGGDHSKRPLGGAPAMMNVSHRPVERGWTPAPTRPRHQPGGLLLYTRNFLGLLLVMAVISAF
jgi:hypothetical protein